MKPQLKSFFAYLAFSFLALPAKAIFIEESSTHFVWTASGTFANANDTNFQFFEEGNYWRISVNNSRESKEDGTFEDSEVTITRLADMRVAGMFFVGGSRWYDLGDDIGFISMTGYYSAPYTQPPVTPLDWFNYVAGATARSVPDGGATLAMIGLSLGCFMGARRFWNMRG